MKDFFISYNKADRKWAEWIAWKLEDAGYVVVIQAWDFRPGENFVLKMQDALKNTAKMVLVLSEDYLNSSFTAAEWSAVFATDPAAKERKIVPVRIRECKPEGLLGPLIYLDLAHLSESDAEAALLGAFAVRSKPSSAPAYPGKKSVSTSLPSGFPGNPHVENRVATVLSQVSGIESAATRISVPVFERVKLNNDLNAITPSQFNMLLFAVNPPPGLIPPMPSPQADRSSALLAWAMTPSGVGLKTIAEVLRLITNPR
ncbi:MAG TPA: toll/interleukin-1 receptor domain-containing protein [Candidatus Angelobacter sp.]|nr:toll/interleukin-1 receptor domain-containing protein [Candidatus Angelobacter sp.]